MRLFLLGLMCSCDGKTDDSVVSKTNSEDTASADDTGVLVACTDPALMLNQEFSSADLHPGPLSEAPPILGSCGWGLAVADLNGDGWLDVLVAGAWASTWPLQNLDGNLTPTDSILFDEGPLPSGNGLTVGDVNNDGLVDVILTRTKGLMDLLYINLGDGHFESVGLADSLGESQTPTVFDADGDGDLDLFVARHINDVDTDLAAMESGTLRGADNGFYRNDGGVFLPMDVPGVPDAASFQGVPLDADSDGDLDLYIVNDFGFWIEPNQLLINDGTGQFTEDVDCGCNVPMFTMGGTVSDANEDGEPDLYLTDLGAPNLFLNDGTGAFYDSTSALRAAVATDADHVTSWGTSFVDFDQDGREDLATVYGPVLSGMGIDWTDLVSHDAVDDLDDHPNQRDVVLLNRSTGFENASEALSFDHDAVGRAVVVGDLNGDGVPDIVTAGINDNRHQYVRVHHGKGGCGPGIAISAPALPARSVGARIDVEVNGREITRWLLPSTTFSSSAPAVYVGLAGATEATSVQVRTTDGEIWMEEHVSAGSQIVITESAVFRRDD